MKEAGEPVVGARITELVTVNGVRVATEDGTWGLVRASSNKPELVVVVERPVSEERLHAMFGAIDAILRAKELAALDCYERRALSRHKFTVRALDMSWADQKQ